MVEQGIRYQVLFTEDDLKNAAAFMERVELTGKEVPAYVRLQRALVLAHKVTVNVHKPEKTAEMPSKRHETGIKVEQNEE